MLGQFLLINKLLQDPGSYNALVVQNELDGRYFYKSRAEFEFLQNHFKTYSKLPSRIVFKDRFPEFEIIDVTDADAYILDKLFEEYNRSYLASLFNEMKPLIESSQTDAAIDSLMKSVDKLKKGRAFTCTDLLANTERYDHYLLDNVKYLSTGFKELDDLIGGIDLQNENMVIAARTGIGKSWTLLKMATEAVRAGYIVGFYSGEMSLDKVGYRIDTLFGGVDNRRITRGDLSYNSIYKHYLDTTLADIRANGGKFLTLTPNDIGGRFATVDTLKAWIERDKIQVLFIDQYSLMEDTSRAMKENERVANISKAVKNLQVSAGIPIISVSQNNRTGEKNKDTGKVDQDTTQIAQSDRIGQDATCVLMLDRDVNEDDPSDEKLIINVVKSRDGGDNRKLVYKADFNTGKFTFIPKAKSKEEAQEMSNAYEDEENPF